MSLTELYAGPDGPAQPARNRASEAKVRRNGSFFMTGFRTRDRLGIRDRYEMESKPGNKGQVRKRRTGMEARRLLPALNCNRIGVKIPRHDSRCHCWIGVHEPAGGGIVRSFEDNNAESLVVWLRRPSGQKNLSLLGGGAQIVEVAARGRPVVGSPGRIVEQPGNQTENIDEPGRSNACWYCWTVHGSWNYCRLFGMRASPHAYWDAGGSPASGGMNPRRRTFSAITLGNRNFSR